MFMLRPQLLSKHLNLFRPVILPITQFSSASTSTSTSSTPKMSNIIGTKIPSTPLHESSPGNKIDLSKELASTKGIIIGVPAAFSPACSSTHIPGYIAHPKVKAGEVGSVFVVAVNDAFAVKAWSEALKKEMNGLSGIRFLADPDGSFTSALNPSLLWSGGRAVFGNDRSKRYAMLVENGEVKKAFVEPDNTGVDVSKAEKVLQ